MAIFTPAEIKKAHAIAAQVKQAAGFGKLEGKLEGNPNLMKMDWPSYNTKPLTHMPGPGGFMSSLGRTMRGLGGAASTLGAAGTVGAYGRHGLIENLGEATTGTLGNVLHGKAPGMSIPHAIAGTFRGAMDEIGQHHGDDIGALHDWSNRTVRPVVQGIQSW